MKKKDFKKKAEILKAMAHPVRLMIIDLLSKREHCVCEILPYTELDQSTLSRHLSVLKNSNIIEDEKRGQKVYYKLLCPCVLHSLDCIESMTK